MKTETIDFKVAHLRNFDPKVKFERSKAIEGDSVNFSKSGDSKLSTLISGIFFFSFLRIITEDFFIYHTFRTREHWDKRTRRRRKKSGTFMIWFILQHERKISTKIAWTRLLLMHGNFTYFSITANLKQMFESIRLEHSSFTRNERKTALLQSLRSDTRIG